MPYDKFRWFGVTYEEARAGCYDGEARLKDMDIDGVAAEILFPPQRTMSHFLGDTDEDFVLGLLRATGILCVHGSGFSYPADRGAFRLIYLAPLDQLKVICDDIAAFTDEFLHQAPGPGPQAQAGRPVAAASRVFEADPPNWGEAWGLPGRLGSCRHQPERQPAVGG
jgi:hypothetical protein